MKNTTTSGETIGPLPNPPDGVIIEDANKVLPFDRVFVYKGNGDVDWYDISADFSSLRLGMIVIEILILFPQPHKRVWICELKEEQKYIKVYVLQEMYTQKLLCQHRLYI